MIFRYPEPTMKLVNEMSAQLAKSYKEKVISKNYKRTFVAASDAVEVRCRYFILVTLQNISQLLFFLVK